MVQHASIDAYLDERAQQRRQSPHTISNYRRDLLRLLALIDEAPGLTVASVQSLHVRRFAAMLHARGLAGRSLARNPADRNPRRLTRYDGKPVDPQRHLPKP